MFRTISLFCVAALVAGVSTISAQTAHTIPVGFTSFSIPAAIDANTPSNAVVSAPFYGTPDFIGAIASVDSSNQITLSGAAFTASAFVGGGATATLPGSPFHLARIKSGTGVGRFFNITANTTNQLTLDTTNYTLTTGAPSTTQVQVAPGDSVEIVPTNSLGNLFGTTNATVPLLGGTSAPVSDNVLLFNGSSFFSYFFRNTDQTWRRTGSGLNQNNTVILPDQAMFITRRSTSGPLNLTFLGTVPSTTEITDFTGPASTFKSVRFPVDTTVAGLALNALPAWQAGTSAATSDNLLLWNGSSFFTYFFRSSDSTWRRAGSGLNQGPTAIPLGTGMFVVRQSTAAGSTSSLTQGLPYMVTP